MLYVPLLVAALASGIFTGWVAYEKNRPEVTWFLLGVLCPLVALIAVSGAPVQDAGLGKGKASAFYQETPPDDTSDPAGPIGDIPDA
ncbi:MAG: hypothetical protein HN396_16760 [Gemmatimonadales bacterium]|jgi:hypothetical protein|nr:hypothetical protein [Gemmatimonadales bacterium]